VTFHGDKVSVGAVLRKVLSITGEPRRGLRLR
jgi:hypothetical protein